MGPLPIVGIVLFVPTLQIPSSNRGSCLYPLWRRKIFGILEEKNINKSIKCKIKTYYRTLGLLAVLLVSHPESEETYIEHVSFVRDGDVYIYITDMRINRK